VIVRSAPRHSQKNTINGTILMFIIPNKVNTIARNEKRLEKSNNRVSLLNENEIDKVMIVGLKRRLKIALSLLSKEKQTEYQLSISNNIQ
jgi:hypothetical protein